MLNFRSANIADWGGPAPAKDAWMYVDYMRYYSDIPTATTAERFSNASHPNLFTIAPTGDRVTLLSGDQLRNNTTVHNLLGTKITTAANCNFSSGIGKITWNASRAVNGTYIFRTNLGTEMQSDLLQLTR